VKFIVLILVVVAIGFFYKRSQREQREAVEAREVQQQSAAEAMYARQEERNQQIRDQLVQQARQRREEQIRQNAPERERIAREFPDAYRRLETKLGRSLDECLVTMRDTHFTSYDKKGREMTTVMLQAQCGPSFEEQVHGN
jgi:Tfp pilus assembly protein PilE